MKSRRFAVATFALSIAGCGGDSKKPVVHAVPPAPHTQWNPLRRLEGWGNANIQFFGDRLWTTQHDQIESKELTSSALRFSGVKGDAPQAVCESNGYALAGGFSIETSPNTGFLLQGKAASGMLAKIPSATKWPAVYSMWCGEKVAYAVANWDDKSGGLLRASTESDASVLEWTRVNLDVGPVRLIDAAGVGDDVWAIGDGGLVVNGSGDTWKKVPSGVTVDLKAIVVAGKGDVYAGGEKGTLIHSTDGGGTWKTIATGSTETIFALHVEKDTILVGTGKGEILVSENGGGTFKSEETEAAREGIRAFVHDQTDTWLAITPDAVLVRNIVK